MKIVHLPLHVTPSPVYPWLQIQVKLPGGVLAQAALVSQLTVHAGGMVAIIRAAVALQTSLSTAKLFA
jgi:hypothetical protein